MLKDKEHSFSMNSGQSSFLRKKLCALSIFMCMLINGFALSTVEMGRHSLFMVTMAAAQNVLSSVIGKCNDSLAEVSNRVYSYINGILFDGSKTGSSGMGSDKDGGESNKQGNTSNAFAAMIKPPSKEIKRIINKKDSELALDGFASAGIFRDGLRRTRPVPRGSCMPAILFLVFIAAIRRRKGISGYICALHMFISGKIRISA